MNQTPEFLPDFSLPDQNGNLWKLSEHLGKKNLVIYFYPKDNTPGCTAEACAFRDEYEDFVAAGAEVVGISADDPASHLKFARKHRLNFTLLADTDHAVHKAFGVSAGLLGLLSGRVTFVADRTGRVVHTFDSRFRARKHITEALRALEKIRAGN